METTNIFPSVYSRLKRISICVVVLLLNFFLFPFSLPAQESEPLTDQVLSVTDIVTSQSDENGNKNYFTVQDGNDTIIFQTINWQAGSYVKWYEVSLEYFSDEGTWLPVTDAIYKHKELYGDKPIPEYLGDGIYKTLTNEIVVVLTAKSNGEPRKYRYSVSSYNLLNKKAFTSEMQEIEVLTARIPHIESSSVSVIYLDEAYDSTIKVSGDNLIDTTQFYLLKDRRRIYPIETEVEKNERSARITFAPDAFDLGEWFITAENPGEFTSAVPLEVRYIKWYELYLSLGYAPTVFLYNDMTKNFLGSGMNWYGGDFKLTFIPFKTTSGYWGLSLTGKFHYLRKTVPIKNTDDSYTLDSFLTQAHLSLVYRYPLVKNRLMLDIHVGMGISSINNMKFSYPNDLYSVTFDGLYFSAIAGTSLSVRVWKNVSILVGFDATYSYIPKLHPIQALPILGIELRF